MRPHNPKATAFVRKWRKCMAVGCTHGDLADPQKLAEVLAFKQAYKPELAFELGDLVDTAPFRAGAKGTPDESKEIDPDRNAAKDWILKYEPTHISYGNHCWRPHDLMFHHNAIIRDCAKKLWQDLQDAAKRVGAETRDYDFETGWFEIGGVFWGHGYWYNESSVRDHAEYLGGPCVIAHLHTAQQVQGRTRCYSPSFCVGTLANIPAMGYARRRRATARWNAGIVFGEVCDKESHLWLASSEKSQPFRFPFPI